MMNDVVRSPLPHGHFQSVQHEFRADMVRHRPADDHAATGVEHHSEIEEAGRGRHEGDIGNPKSVGLFGGEVAIDEVECWPGSLVTSRRRRAAFTAGGAHQPRTAHETGNSLRPCRLPSTRS